MKNNKLDNRKILAKEHVVNGEKEPMSLLVKMSN